MKRLFFGVVFSLGVMGFVYAQDISKNAIGLRLGDNDGFGSEISYQRAIGVTNRLEVDLGWRTNSNFDAYRLTGLYQWIWELDYGFNWYAGAGAGIAQVDFTEGFTGFNADSDTYFYAAGNVGIEYRFPIPLLLSLDFRPEIGFGDYNDDLDFDIALGVRYLFQ